jgi:hypothetical protein
MTWTLHEYEEQLRITQTTGKFQFATNEEGVRIEGGGSRRDIDAYIVFLEYRHEEIAVNFVAGRPSRDMLGYHPRRDPITLGPVAVVLSISTRPMGRSLTAQELDNVKRNIVDHLIQAYPRLNIAVPPYPEDVTFVA